MLRCVEMCWRLISDGRKHSIQCARLERVGPLGYVQHEVGLGDQKKKNNLKKGGGRGGGRLGIVIVN